MAAKKPTSGKKGAPRRSPANPLNNRASTGKKAPIEQVPEPLPAGIEDEIRRRAYELFQARGGQEGFDREDWVQAEAEVLSRRERKGRATG